MSVDISHTGNEAGRRSLGVLIEALEKGHLLVMNGSVVIELDEPFPLTNDHSAWMALDQDDFAALKSLAIDVSQP